jgi:hypothetical protein
VKYLKIFLGLFLVCFLSVEIYAESFCHKSENQHAEKSHSESTASDKGESTAGHCGSSHCLSSILNFEEPISLIFIKLQTAHQQSLEVFYSENCLKALFRPPILFS